MLKRIYVDNYKSLVNFELNLDRLTVLLGENGAGKSTVFEVLSNIQQFISGTAKVDKLFLFKDRCRWQTQLTQKFELDFTTTDDQDIYHYILSIEHTKDGDKTKVKEEKLLLDGKPLFSFEQGEIQLYDDASRPGPKFPFDWTQSGLATIYSRRENTKLTQFKEQVSRMVIAQIIPSMMLSGVGEKGELLPTTHLENYVSWYRTLSQDQGLVNRLTQNLSQVLENFNSFRFVPPTGTIVWLEAAFSYEGIKNNITYRFDELSDGQRMLIALYTLLEAARNGNYILCLDEPENFISLPEIQPWLNAIYDMVGDSQSQALLISHHPEAIDLFSDHARWLERSTGLPTRVSSLPESDDELRVSEIIARRWLK